MVTFDHRGYLFVLIGMYDKHDFVMLYYDFLWLKFFVMWCGGVR